MKSFSKGVFKSEEAVNFLKVVGFEPSVSNDVLVYPFDKGLQRLMMAREALVSKVAGKLDGT